MVISMIFLREIIVAWFVYFLISYVFRIRHSVLRSLIERKKTCASFGK